MSCTLIAALALSAHIGLEGDYNSVHPAIKCDRDNTGFIAGAYYNSERRVSVYAGLKLAGEGPFWAEVGAVTGYRSHDILPMARAGIDLNDHVSLFVAPAYEENRYGETNYGVVVGTEVRF